MIADWHEIPGWWSDACAAFYRQCVEQAPPRAHFVEVGSWQGRSAATMALAIRDLGARVRFDCIDTWKGTPAEGDAGHHQRLIREGGLDLRAAFDRHLGALGVRDLVTAVEGDSAEVAIRYPDNSLDLVFIDGDHRREMVARDCRAWLPKLRYGGLLAGHDGDAENVIAGVRAAGVNPERKGQIWWWRKRLAVTVHPEASALTAGVLADWETERWFGPSIAREAAEILPRYFEIKAGGMGIIGDCGALDGYLSVTVCPCDQHRGPHLPEQALRRSAYRSRNESVFPAFPHGISDPWPFLSRAWGPPPSQGGHLVGFCGVTHRPETRKRALEALLGATGEVSAHIIDRQQFLGQEVGRKLARREFLSTLLNCPFQLCVRGAGNYCYRLYETLAAGRVPVLIDTDRPLPWAEQLPWSSMAVIVPEDDLKSIGRRVRAWAEEHDPESQGRVNRRIWWDYLSPVGWWREWARRQA